MPTETVQNYLKAIYQLGDGGVRAVALGELARELGVTPGTVTVMIQRMDEGGGLVDYRKREGVVLTGEGRLEALRVLRRHRVVETFLVDMIGLGWEEVHDEAERLEHAMSDRVIERIAELLGHPEYDPHGTPIPDADGGMPEEVRQPLSEAAPGEYTVVGYLDGDEAFLKACGRRGLGHGAILRVVENDREADTVRVAVCAGDSPRQWNLGGGVAGRILARHRHGSADA